MNKKVKSPKLWALSRADAEFSKWIRARDGKCLKCGGSNRLSCSHFWSRSIKALRFEPDNCITLCWFSCHKHGWEKQKHGKYGDFMLAWLGKDRFAELKAIAYDEKRMSQKEAIERCMKFLGAWKIVKENNER